MTYSRVQRFGMGLLAVISSSIAIFLLWWAGLPQRAASRPFVLDGMIVAPEIGAIAPPFSVHSLNGDLLRLDDWRGQWVVINFWATWCAPCVVEMPALQAFYEETGITVLAVNIGEDRHTVIDWVSDGGYGFEVILDRDSNLYRLYQVRGQPSTYLIRPDGIISEIFFGAITNDRLQQTIAETTD